LTIPPTSGRKKVLQKQQEILTRQPLTSNAIPTMIAPKTTATLDDHYGKYFHQF